MGIEKVVTDPKKAVSVAATHLLETPPSDWLAYRQSSPGLDQYISGKYALSKGQGDTNQWETNWSDKTVSRLRSNEVVKLGQMYDESLLRSITSTYNDLLEEGTHKTVIREIDGEVYTEGLNNWEMDTDIFELIPELRELLTGDVLSLLEQYYGGYFVPKTFQIYRTHHIPPDVGSNPEPVTGNTYHLDGHPIDQVKLFVCLNDIEPDETILKLVPTPVSKRAMRSVGYDAITDPAVDDNGFDRDETVKFAGPFGNVAIANTTRNLHRGENPKPGEYRDILQIQFSSSTSPMPDDWSEIADQYPKDGLYRYTE